jgi:2'-5' RNA ligase
MSLIVIAYPQIEKKDYEWIQKIRARHDKRYYRVVEPHFTIVFPVSGIVTEPFIEDIAKKVKEFKEYYFVLRCAQIVKDSFSDYTDVFLIPEEGYRIFVKLHDLLYTGSLEKELRLDIPFIPHLGIANNIDPRECKLIADGINDKGVEIVGAVYKLDIAAYENNTIQTLKEIYLPGA